MKKLLLIFLIPIASLLSQSSFNNRSLIDKNKLKRHLEYLGDDLFEGRGTGELGGDLAAKYLAVMYNRLNLTPVGDNGTYYQYIPMHASKTLKSSRLKIYQNNEESELELGEDYLLYNSGDQTFIPMLAELVFVGYGIIASEYDYNDYQEIDVEGKIAVMLSGEPHSNEHDFFTGDYPTIYSYPESKQRLASSRGAKGSIIISNPLENDNKEWEHLKIQFSFEDIKLAYTITNNFGALLNYESAHKIFKNSRYKFADVLEMHKSNSIKSFELGTEITFNGNFANRDFIAPNVIAKIDGTDPELKDEYLVISAHYDHLGLGTPVNGDSIYNGIMDNAIGCAAVLELARVLSSAVIKRSVLIILVTGEEKGLLGSTYYTGHPVVPLHKTIANINIDGIAAYDNFKSIIGVGRELSSLNSTLKKVAILNGLKVVNIPPQFKQWESFNRSDQMAFAKAGIPSILTMDGPDYINKSRDEGIQHLIDYNMNIYHTPFDDLTQEINYEAAVQQIEFIYDLCIELLNAEETPEWNSGVFYNNARLQSIAEGR
ncbi:MAG: M28 family peptidase [Melioribacteraceae bacterium]|nr:M28 family peptidase [Melioribacteraceae bacterium]